jgi:hypothetical protein
MPTVIEYPFDSTGELVSNLVINDIKTAAPQATGYVFIVPDAAPFYEEGFQMRRTDTNALLVEGVDFFFTHRFETASVNTTKPVFGSVSFYFGGFTGQVSMRYQTVGGSWVLNTNEVLEDLYNRTINPRIVYWEQVVDYPALFPVIDHGHSAEDTTTFADVIAALNEIGMAIEQNNEQNSEYATPTEALAGVRGDRIISPATLALVVNSAISGSVTSTIKTTYLIGYGHSRNLAKDLFGDALFIDTVTDPGLKLIRPGASYIVNKGVAFVGGMRVEVINDLILTNPSSLPRDLWLIVIIPDDVTGGNHSPVADFVWNAAGTPLIYNAGDRAIESVKIATVDVANVITDLRRTQKRGYGLAFPDRNAFDKIDEQNGVIVKNTPTFIDASSIAPSILTVRLPKIDDIDNPVEVDDWVYVERSGSVIITSFNGTTDRIRIEKPDGSYQISNILIFNLNVPLRLRWNGVYWEV